MDSYYGVIYYKNGNQDKTSTFSGVGAERSCEIETARRFEQATKRAVSDFFKPTRYEVKKK